MTGVRLDKWLWAARFFKTRALASRACELGRIECNAQPAKASREVRVADRLRIRSEAGDFAVQVLLLSDMRGPAAVAQTLYLESDESKRLRQKAVEERKTMPRFDSLNQGKPSKRNRRDFDRIRGRT